MTKNKKTKEEEVNEAKEELVTETQKKEFLVRIEGLDDNIIQLEQEIRTLKGKLENRKKASAEKIHGENQLNHRRLESLEKAIYAVMVDSGKARDPEAVKDYYDHIRKITVEFCKRNGVDFELWKNIAY